MFLEIDNYLTPAEVLEIPELACEAKLVPSQRSPTGCSAMHVGAVMG
ncbi:MAG: hypothetical protein ABI356_01575 [Steroidobacteraceae bacterium]